MDTLKDLLNTYGQKLRGLLDYDNLRTAGEVASMTPTPLGDVMSGLLAVDDLRKGDYWGAAGNAVGLLPFVPGMAGIFAGKGAKTADLAKQGIAEKMLAEGADPAKVWKETGWGIGPDGKWRFEIPDDKAKWSKKVTKEDLTLGMPLGKTYSHKYLTDAYPDIKGANIRIGDDHAASYASYINPQGVRIEDITMPQWTNPRYDAKELVERNASVGTVVDPLISREISKEDALIHELQHAIAKREGFASGGSGVDKGYKKLAGEAEARLAEARMNMNTQQRMSSYPFDARYFEEVTGVPIKSLLFRYD